MSQIKNIALLDLRPTQFVLGSKEIAAKIRRISNFSKQEWKEFRDDHVIPVIAGPGEELYMIDHHHFARACWELGKTDFKIEIIKNLKHLNEQQFWNHMIQKGWTYLHDQFGMGPHRPQDLPTDIRCLADDPFRSLAWAVLDAHGFKKVDIPFFEFQWAAFYRQNLGMALHSKSDFKDALKKAMSLSKSKDAAHLPGYRKK